MKLTLLLNTGPDNNNTATAIRLAKTANDKGHEVTIFAMADGVFNLACDEFTKLAGEGVKLAVCDHNREENKAPANVDGVMYGSQYDLAIYANSNDRFVSFT